MDTLNGKSAPHTPGPWIDLMRTMPGPSLTVPALRHCSSASRRHGSPAAHQFSAPPPELRTGKHIPAATASQHAEDAKTDGADEIPTSSPRHGRDNAWDFVNDCSKIRPWCMPLADASRYG